MLKNNLPEAAAAQSIYTGGCYAAIKEDLKGVVVALCVVLFILAIVEVSVLLVGSGITHQPFHSISQQEKVH